MGVKPALFGETRYGPETGRPLIDNPADYLVCVTSDMTAIETHFVGGSDLLCNPMGCRGVGETDIVGIAAAITGAVQHAAGHRPPRARFADHDREAAGAG